MLTVLVIYHSFDLKLKYRLAVRFRLSKHAILETLICYYSILIIARVSKNSACYSDRNGRYCFIIGYKLLVYMNLDCFQFTEITDAFLNHLMSYFNLGTRGKVETIHPEGVLLTGQNSHIVW